MNKKVITLIIVVALLAIIGIVYFITSKNNENSRNQTISDSNINLGNTEENNSEIDSENQTENATNEGLKTLIVYFSVPETEDPNNMTQDEDNSTVVVDGEVLGNTQYVAQLIGEYTGGDIFRLEPVDTYPTNHETYFKEQQRK